MLIKCIFPLINKTEEINELRRLMAEVGFFFKLLHCENNLMLQDCSEIPLYYNLIFLRFDEYMIDLN